MASKGISFEGINDPKIPASVRRRRPERIQAWVDQQHEEFAIVGQCEQCRRDLIAREVEPHKLSHIADGRARQICGMLLHPKTSPATTLAEVRAFLETLE